MPKVGDTARCVDCRETIIYDRFLGREGPLTWRHTSTNPNFHGVGCDAGVVRSHFAEPGPEIVCLCGSTRFWLEFQEAALGITLDGGIYLSVGCMTASDEDHGITPEQKVEPDELHKRKIDLADRVMVLNVDGYVGKSTVGEIAYAVLHSKPIEWLEPLRVIDRTVGDVRTLEFPTGIVRVNRKRDTWEATLQTA